jgi:lambda repressor-like predicted transcriptional regulator
MRNQGWIKLDRAIFDWGWYTDLNVKSVFLHLLLRANHKPTQWKEIEMKRGQLYTSLDTLVREIGLSKQKIRTALDKLKLTGEITSDVCSRGRLVTVINYDRYQSDNTQDNRQSTGNQQASNSELTADKKLRREEGKNTPSGGCGGGELFYEVDAPLKKQAKTFVPPSREEFIAYAVETLPKKNPDWSPEQATRCADHQFETYIDQNWRDGNGKPVKNWKSKSINSMLHKKPWSFGNNPQSFLEQKKRAANSASPL